MASKYKTEEERREAKRIFSRIWDGNNKEARAVYLRKWKDKNRERLYQERRDNPMQSMLYSAKSSAKKRGLEFSLTREDLPETMPEFCPALGLKLEFGRGVFCNGSPTLDRIDNSKGYIPGNVVIVSMMANSMKRNATIAQLESLYKFYSSLEKRSKND